MNPELGAIQDSPHITTSMRATTGGLNRQERYMYKLCVSPAINSFPSQNSLLLWFSDSPESVVLQVSD
ncbi:hypothetical protein [Coleofasciculus sp. H7-2]|uniref:hypothetical protein n=1 Tax=Coleofasciculus sp. H7-2 TaxID=3351545 RepID=UPI00366E2495